MSKKYGSLDIIIVNWNSGSLLIECLDSINDSLNEGFILSNIVVIDNASTDDSLDYLHQLGLPIKAICNSNNIGFAAACNQGAKNSKADYILFLNPDTRLFTNSLIQPIEFMQQPENVNVGICGIQLVDEKGTITHTCVRFPRPSRFLYMMFGLDRLFPEIFSSHFMTDFDHSDCRIVDQIMGAFFMIRQPLFERLDGFDERFFVYYEDADLSYRALKCNYHSYYLATAQAFHKGRGTTDQIKATRLSYSLYTRIQYSYKHFTWLEATMVLLSTLLIEPFSRLVFIIGKRSISEIPEIFRGYIKFWQFILTR